MKGALSEEEYAAGKLELLRRLELEVPVLSCHKVSQAVCDPIDARHRDLLPDYVWGDGAPAGVQQRATEEVIATVTLPSREEAPEAEGEEGAAEGEEAEAGSEEAADADASGGDETAES